ncbi:saccharopine dehydrogenase NADP-binding domain-containing protein [Paucibacter sp. APW11]|uniref:Saccharopine dehydrogenase NADP-binding domain-containing protein n=1 Tax=Roseateles aquae TaxID=3077235 RepID=A0ABU3PDV5_9BURK|nr:saccharopine dehydrogenase NADP-binding domain-containing protein [Paucibacter sp. APW11]MDT9000307.1 saccharopine dehydrogenase NADP-binding domain-containing protein [Paucibacter sp. APW11]
MSYELIVFGATGFTGRLVADYLFRRYGVGGSLRWAIAGRSAARLAEVRESIGAPLTLPLLVADAGDARALKQLVTQARVVISTVGPYQRHGEPLIRACAEAGTDYVDLCGEPAWMATMIPQLQGLAGRSGARICFSCGFDSIPFDLGLVFLQSEALARFGRPLQQVAGRVAVLKGSASGGTIASALASYEAASRDPEQARLMADPFALTPGFRGPAQPSGEGAVFDDTAQAWAAPFVMAVINTKNVHRSNALRGHPWGRDFIYDERLLTGSGAKGERRARALARMSLWQDRLLGFAPTRSLLRRFVLPKPGEGPSAEQRERGRYEVVFYGQTADGQRLSARVKGQGDPGYGSTSKLISEAALCLLEDVGHEATPGGVWTPGAAMGLALQRRLQERAGLSFAIEG